MASDAPVPVHVLTGFLGSGKTTLLGSLLRRPRGERLAAVVNEVGALALEPGTYELVDEDLWTLASGCLCCARRAELHESMDRVLAHRPSRIVLETSGLADPGPILHAFATDPRLVERVRLAGVVTVVDALRAEDLLATQPEAVRQLELADRVVLSKPDLAPHRLDGVRELLSAAAPGCDVRVALHGEVDPDWLLGAPALARLTAWGDAHSWLHHEPTLRAAGAFSTRTVRVDHPVDLDVLVLWTRLVTQLDGPRLLRIKMLLEDAGTGATFALQAAGRLVSPPRRLAARPGGLRGLHAVLVERGLGEPGLERLVESLHSAANATPAPRGAARRVPAERTPRTPAR